MRHISISFKRLNRMEFTLYEIECTKSRFMMRSCGSEKMHLAGMNACLCQYKIVYHSPTDCKVIYKSWFGCA